MPKSSYPHAEVLELYERLVANIPDLQRKGNANPYTCCFASVAKAGCTLVSSQKAAARSRMSLSWQLAELIGETGLPRGAGALSVSSPLTLQLGDTFGGSTIHTIVYQTCAATNYNASCNGTSPSQRFTG